MIKLIIINKMIKLKVNNPILNNHKDQQIRIKENQ